MLFQGFQQRRSKAEIPTLEFFRILWPVHPCQIEYKVAFRTKAIQILQRILLIILIYSFNGKRRTGLISAIHQGTQVLYQILPHKARSAGYQYFHRIKVSFSGRSEKNDHSKQRYNTTKYVFRQVIQGKEKAPPAFFASGAINGINPRSNNHIVLAIVVLQEIRLVIFRPVQQ